MMELLTDYSKTGQISQTLTLIKSMNLAQIDLFKVSVFEQIKVVDEQGFLCWMLSNSKHILGDEQVTNIYSTACNLTSNTTIKYNTCKNDYLTKTVPDTFNHIGSYLNREDSVKLSRSSKQIHLKTQKQSYLKQSSASGHLQVNDHLLDKLQLNTSNPHLYGAPKSLNLWLPHKCVYIKYYKIWQGRWYHGLYHKISKFGIYGGNALRHFVLSNGVKSLFDSKTGRNEVECITFGGQYHKKEKDLFYLSSSSSAIAILMKRFKHCTNVKRVQVTPSGKALNWTTLLSALSATNFRYLTLNNAIVKIPTIFHPKLIALGAIGNTKFEVDQMDDDDDGEALSTCKLRKISLVCSNDNIVSFTKLFKVLYDHKLVEEDSVCKLQIFQGKFREHGLEDDEEEQISLDDETEDMMRCLFTQSLFRVIVVHIQDSQWLHLLYLFLKFVGDHNYCISSSIKELVFEVSLADDEQFPLITRQNEEYDIMDEEYDVNSNEVIFNVGWHDNEAYFLNVMDWLNHRWEVYGTTSGTIKLKYNVE